jgi:protein ImuB
MNKRFVAIWFKHIKADWMQKRNLHLKDVPFVLAKSDHGRMVITEVSLVAKTKGIYTGMVVSDAKVIYPALHIVDDIPGLNEKLLKNIAEWCIRYSPIVTVDLPNGIILDATGCTHLWNGEEDYLKDIINKLKSFGYNIRPAMADTIGTAWAVSRYGKVKAIIETGEQYQALMSLPPIALRIQPEINEKLQKLGLTDVGSFINMQASALRRRFGADFLLRLNQALGTKEEYIQSVIPLVEYSERLPCLELIQTKTGIEIALQKLLEKLCSRLMKEGKGLREVNFIAYRIDNKIEKISVTTNHASNNPKHIFKLLEYKIETIEPALGIELFVLEATKVEKVISIQQTLWTTNGSLESREIAELLDNIENKFGENIINRYFPNEHHSPERSIKKIVSLKEKPVIEWQTDKLRPANVLPVPIPIKVTAPIPDYPPMNFQFNNKLHKVIKADACERIEPEWWIEGGLHRDYYIVENEEGKRYWLYRLGHYNEDEKPQWFLHGVFD